MVDATTGHEALSFMDGSSGYNKIRIALEDEELTAFRTPKGIYCYKVMPFGLKNVGATYQCVMQKIFNDMLHKKRRMLHRRCGGQDKEKIRPLEGFTNGVRKATKIQPQDEPVKMCVWCHLWKVPWLHCQAPWY
ncbi:hypothetical protein COP2_015137 [Malus domestica]